MTNESNGPPYGSGRDLPTFIAIEDDLKRLSRVRLLLPRDANQRLREMKTELDEMADVVDRFYKLLGERNWVFNDSLNIDAMREVVSTDDPATAEQRLIDYYTSEANLDLHIGRLFRFESMRTRLRLIRKALIDFEFRRYYSTVLVLITVLDGFVNDVDKAHRRGLHARDVSEMAPWDSVAGHHMGLAHAHRSFVKSFKKTTAEEVFELYRNGIVHGTVVNFDNVVVAAKAWNRLFAVADWASSLDRKNHPPEYEPTLRELLQQHVRLSGDRKRIDAWEPRIYSPRNDDNKDSAVFDVVQQFFEQWRKKRWALLGAHFIGSQNTPSTSKIALEAKELYSPFELTDWEIQGIDHRSASLSFVEAALTVDGSQYNVSLRWVYTDPYGQVDFEWNPGEWKLSLYGPTHFITRENLIEPSANVGLP